MISKLESTVPDGLNEISALNYVDRAWPFIGRSRISALLKRRQLRVNGARSGLDALVRGGDEIILYLDGEYDMSLKLKYMDADVVAFIKPRGLPTDADVNGIGEDTALKRLRLIFPDARLVHRLDAGTYGIMLAAIGEKSEAEISGLFKNGLLVKKYTATAVGHMPSKSETLKAFLVKDSDNSKVKVFDEYRRGALEITTVYTVKREIKKDGVMLSLLEIEIPTGRTHQIRAHLAHIKHPLLGDDKYGFRDVNKKLGASQTDLCCAEISVKNEAEAGRYAGMRFGPEGKNG